MERKKKIIWGLDINYKINKAKSPKPIKTKPVSPIILLVISTDCLNPFGFLSGGLAAVSEQEEGRATGGGRRRGRGREREIGSLLKLVRNWEKK